MNKMLSIDDIDVENKKVLVRVDFNVPIKDGVITDDTRIVKSLPTLKKLLEKKAKVLVISHLGRPVLGQDNLEFTLLPVANKLKELLEYPVHFAKEWLDGIDCNIGEVIVCENIRFFAGETKNDPKFAKRLGVLCDVFVMDAFACAHRAHASTAGIVKYAPASVAGPLLIQEIKALDQILEAPKHPVVAIVGGSKVSTKLTILQQLVNKVDVLIVGGGIANTFLVASGYNIGNSLYEPDFVDLAKDLLSNKKCKILFPKDVIVADQITDQVDAKFKDLLSIDNNEKVLDIGPETLSIYTKELQLAKTILWNGPVGVFEYKPFASGTKHLAKAIADSSAYSVAGGGDTISAIKQFNVASDISYISTGGGAFLEYIEGKTLPGIEVLR